MNVAVHKKLSPPNNARPLCFGLSTPPPHSHSSQTSPVKYPGQSVRHADRLTMPARVAWLAFCSGPCVKREGRQVPHLVGLLRPQGRPGAEARARGAQLSQLGRPPG
jgi:hypothetical protein